MKLSTVILVFQVAAVSASFVSNGFSGRQVSSVLSSSIKTVDGKCFGDDGIPVQPQEDQPVWKTKDYAYLGDEGREHELYKRTLSNPPCSPGQDGHEWKISDYAFSRPGWVIRRCIFCGAKDEWQYCEGYRISPPTKDFYVLKSKKTGDIVKYDFRVKAEDQ